LLREAPHARHGEHAIARRKLVDALSDCADRARDFTPGHEGERWLDLVLAAHEECIDVVEARGGDRHLQLAGAGLGLGLVLQRERGA